jgi:hypothetical protein
MVRKVRGKDYGPQGTSACTLPLTAVAEAEEVRDGTFTKVHPDGWTITGDLVQEWVCFVNNFSAVNQNGDWVRGDFGTVVWASSEEAFDDFVAAHPFHEWDYEDI